LQGDVLRLACLQSHFLEGFQFLDWTLNLRRGVANINLS
jgi:hypothetical protein